MHEEPRNESVRLIQHMMDLLTDLLGGSQQVPSEHLHEYLEEAVEEIIAELFALAK